MKVDNGTHAWGVLDWRAQINSGYSLPVELLCRIENIDHDWLPREISPDMAQ